MRFVSSVQADSLAFQAAKDLSKMGFRVLSVKEGCALCDPEIQLPGLVSIQVCDDGTMIVCSQTSSTTFFIGPNANDIMDVAANVVDAFLASKKYATYHHRINSL